MNEPLDELLIFYAIGGLTDEERARVEAYLQTNPQAQAELEKINRITTILRADVRPTLPSPETKDRLMARIRGSWVDSPSTVPTPTAVAPLTPSLLERWRASWRHRPLPAYAFAIVIITLLGIWALSLSNQVTNQRAELMALSTRAADLENNLAEQQAAVSSLEAENEALRQALREQDMVLALFSAPDVQTVIITGTEDQPQATGILLIQPEPDASYLYVSGLEPLPEDSIYQLWLVGSEGPVGAGIFNVHEDGTGVLQISSEYPLSSYTAAGVSVEPAGGSPQPTGHGVLRGRLSS